MKKQTVGTAVLVTMLLCPTTAWAADCGRDAVHARQASSWRDYGLQIASEYKALGQQIAYDYVQLGRKAAEDVRALGRQYADAYQDVADDYTEQGQQTAEAARAFAQTVKERFTAGLSLIHI